MMGGGRIDHQNKKTTDITINPIDIEKKIILYLEIIFQSYLIVTIITKRNGLL